MTHVARGVDDQGVLTVDVVMRGQVPELADNVLVTVLPYTEQYIQTGPGLFTCLCLCLCLFVYVCVCLIESVCVHRGQEKAATFIFCDNFGKRALILIILLLYIYSGPQHLASLLN